MTRFNTQGDIQYPDKDGFLINDLLLRRPLQPNWRRALTVCIDRIVTLHRNVIHSIYLRGSVARSEAVEYVSDLDIVVILKPAHTDSEKFYDIAETLKIELTDLLKTDFPFIAGVDVEAYGANEILAFDDYCPIRVLLTIQSICVHGTDLISKLPLLRPGPDCFVCIPTIREKVTGLRSQLRDNPTLDVSSKSKWIAKQFIRLGFELCMERSNFYTRDLYPSFSAFIKYYPEHSENMREAVDMALSPTDDRRAVEEIMRGLGEWLMQEAARLYPTYINGTVEV